MYPVFPSVANTASQLGQNIKDNWREFLLGRNAKTSQAVVPHSSQTVTYAAPDALRAEINQIIDERFIALNGVDQSFKGLIVFPANKASMTPEIVARSFSDQVIVEPDGSGQSGIIRPIFRDHQGEDYIYVLTPINQ